MLRWLLIGMIVAVCECYRTSYIHTCTYIPTVIPSYIFLELHVCFNVCRISACMDTYERVWTGISASAYAVSTVPSWLHTLPVSTVVSLQSSSTNATNQSFTRESTAVSTPNGVASAGPNIIGIVVGCFVGVVLIALAVAVAIKLRKHAAKKHPDESPRSNAPDEVALLQPDQTRNFTVSSAPMRTVYAFSFG